MVRVPVLDGVVAANDQAGPVEHADHLVAVGRVEHDDLVPGVALGERRGHAAVTRADDHVVGDAVPHGDLGVMLRATR